MYKCRDCGMSDQDVPFYNNLKSKSRCIDCSRKWDKVRYADNPRQSLWYQSLSKDEKEELREKRAATKSAYNRRVKERVIGVYGGVCTCCGESELAFLCIDHMENNGMQHRKDNAISSGTSTYQWLTKQGYPSGFQVLCFNCNNAKRWGECPHRRQEKVNVA